MTGTPSRRLIPAALIATLALLGWFAYTGGYEDDPQGAEATESASEGPTPGPAPVIETDLETTVVEEDPEAQAFALTDQVLDVGASAITGELARTITAAGR